MIQIDASMYPDVDIRNAVAIKIADANMSPVINKDDTIMIDRSKRDIHHGKFYVVNYIGMYMVVRIFKTQFGLTLSSANPSLPTHEGVDEKDVNVIGRVIYRMENIG
jgi:phage repressor protein C with HTH and peptisase S24 domain